MVEIQNPGSLFYLPQDEKEAAAITTNGVLRKNGYAVLGRGKRWKPNSFSLDWKSVWANTSFATATVRSIWVCISWGSTLHL